MRVVESWLSWDFSSTLIDYRQTWAKREKTLDTVSTTLKKNLSRFKFDESARESMRVHESFRPNESKILNSQQLSSSFGPGFADYPPITSTFNFVGPSLVSVTENVSIVRMKMLFSSCYRYSKMTNFIYVGSVVLFILTFFLEGEKYIFKNKSRHNYDY